MTCLHSSDGMDDTWTRKPSPTARWLLISPESRRGMLNTAFRELVVVGDSIVSLFNVFFPYLFSAEGVMRTMTTEKLLKGMPVLQTLIDTLLEFDVSPTLTMTWHIFLQTRAASHDRSFSPSFLISGSSQGAEQWDHQCRIPAPLQGPGQNVRILQRRNHQPIRSVESWRPLAWHLEDVSVDHDESEPVRRLFSQRNTSRWRRATVRRPWRSTRGSWPGWQRSGNSWSWLRWATFNTTS